jgi:biotin carboxyl carrier protein
MRYHVTIGQRTHEVVVEPGQVLVDGVPVDARLAGPAGSKVLRLRVGTSTHRLIPERSDDGVRTFHLGGRRIVAEVVDERTRAIQAMAGGAATAQRAASVRAPMPGLVVKVEVAVGDEVVRGQGVAVVEAMKMENELLAETDGRVVEVRVSPGETVEKGQVLVDLDPTERG